MSLSAYNAVSGARDRTPSSVSVRCVGARRALLVAASLALSALPEVAEACSVCSAGRDDATRLAFILTTIFLSVLPLSMVGGVVWWLRSRTRAHDRSAAPGHVGAQAPAGALRT